MDTVGVLDYTQDEKSKICSFTSAQVQMLLCRQEGVRCLDPMIKAWPIPNIVQVKYLQTVKTGKLNVDAFKPTQIQERTLMAGGRIEYNSVRLPFTDTTTVGFTTILPDAKESEWVVDVIPVQMKAAELKPGLGRVVSFCATMLKVKDSRIVPIFDCSQDAVFEVKMINYTGVRYVGELLENMFRDQKEVVPVGSSGLNWIDKLYQVVSSSSVENFDGLSGVILSQCYNIGSLDSGGTLTTSPVLTSMLVERQRKSTTPDVPIPAPQTVKRWAPGRLEYYLQHVPSFKFVTLPGYLIGDAFSDGRQLSCPETAPGIYNAIQKVMSSRGGSHGAAALLSGRYSIGMPSQMLASLEEMLTILLGLEEPYNVFGLTSIQADIYERACVSYNRQSHRFVGDYSVLSKHMHKLPNILLPRICFSYMGVENEYKLDLRDTKEKKLAKHLESQQGWAERFFSTDKDIWVGCNVLPFVPSTIAWEEWERQINKMAEGVEKMNEKISYQREQRFSRIKAKMLGTPFDGRGIFSVCEISQANHRGLYKHPDGREVRELSLSSLKSMSGKEWGAAVFHAVMAVPGYVVHPCRFKKKSVAALVPTFKDVRFFRNYDDHWEMAGVDGTLKYVPERQDWCSSAPKKPPEKKTIDFGDFVIMPAPQVAPVVQPIVVAAPIVPVVVTAPVSVLRVALESSERHTKSLPAFTLLPFENKSDDVSILFT